ncbi:Uclacyanin-2 [Bienertia sinuspersici]
MAFGAAFVVILVVAPLAYAAQYPVDWTTGTDYSSWTTKSLNAGDTLVCVLQFVKLTKIKHFLPQI